MKQKNIGTTAAFVFALAVMLGFASSALADVAVYGPFVDDTTGGDWRGTYGECFFMVPFCEDREVECPTGPDLFSVEPTQYMYTNCYGGDLFDNDPMLSHIDWRIFRNHTDPEVFTWTYPPEQMRAGVPQWNPCLNEFDNGTWDNDRFNSDPITHEIILKTGGDATLAYYFLNNNVECRELDYNLMVDGVEMAYGTIGDFAGGAYVVFELEGLEDKIGGTAIAFTAMDAAGDAQCDPPADILGINSVISGLFINGTDVCSPGGEGCTPGFWKQRHHFHHWPAAYAPTDSYDTTFGVTASFGDISLLAALWQGGGGEKALGRHATSALLNATTDGVNFGYTPAQVIAMVQDAYSTGDYEAVKNMLSHENEMGCPLSGRMKPARETKTKRNHKAR